VQNPHPLLVHYPIAFLVVFAVSTLLLLVRPRPGLDRFARACLFVGTAAAALTVISGFLAEQNVAPVRAAAEPLTTHRTAGYVVLATACALTALAIVEPRLAARAGLLRATRSIGALVLLAALFLAGKEGGELVFEHGVGTRMTAPGGPLHDPSAPPSTKPQATGDAPAPSGKDFR
jgi:uncharacterized membrane protein